MKKKEAYYPVIKSSDRMWLWLTTDEYYKKIVLKRAKKYFSDNKWKHNTSSAVARSILNLSLPLEACGKNNRFVGRFNLSGWWLDCQMGDMGTHRHCWPVRDLEIMHTKAEYFSIELFLSPQTKFGDEVAELKICDSIQKIDSTTFQFGYSWGDNLNWKWVLFFDSPNSSEGRVEIYFD